MIDGLENDKPSGGNWDKTEAWTISKSACTGYYWRADGDTNKKCAVGEYGDNSTDNLVKPEAVTQSGNGRCYVSKMAEAMRTAFPHVVTYWETRTLFVPATTGTFDLSAAVTIPGSPDASWTTYLTNYKAAMLDWHGNFIQEEIARTRIT